MSTAMNFGTKTFKPRPPDKGSFPLDHFGECKPFKDIFMKCLRENSFQSNLCREESKEYLECRMESKLSTIIRAMESHLEQLTEEEQEVRNSDTKNKENFFFYKGNRRKRQLMAKEPLEKLGFKDLVSEETTQEQNKL